MKTILILGGYGFIGTNILDYIEKNYAGQYNVVLFDKSIQHPHGLQFSCLKKCYSGDFSDETNLTRIFEENHIDFVFHLLSSTVPATSANAQYDVQSNLIPTLRLLDIMNKYGVKDNLYMSSGGAVYGDYLQKIHEEEDAVYPRSSYGVVKLAIEKYMLVFAELFNFRTLILRLSNPYGPFHYNNKQGLINIAIRKALAGEPLEIWGTGEGKKDYIYVEDAIRMIFMLIEKGFETNVYNIASGTVYSINEIVNVIRGYIPDFKWEYKDASPTDVQSFELSISKLQKRIGVCEMRSLADGIKETILWQQHEYTES